MLPRPRPLLHLRTHPPSRPHPHHHRSLRLRPSPLLHLRVPLHVRSPRHAARRRFVVAGVRVGRDVGREGVFGCVGGDGGCGYGDVGVADWERGRGVEEGVWEAVGDVGAGDQVSFGAVCVLRGCRRECALWVWSFCFRVDYGKTLKYEYTFYTLHLCFTFTPSEPSTTPRPAASQKPGSDQ